MCTWRWDNIPKVKAEEIKRMGPYTCIKIWHEALLIYQQASFCAQGHHHHVHPYLLHNVPCWQILAHYSPAWWHCVILLSHLGFITGCAGYWPVHEFHIGFKDTIFKFCLLCLSSVTFPFCIGKSLDKSYFTLPCEQNIACTLPTKIHTCGSRT